MSVVNFKNRGASSPDAMFDAFWKEYPKRIAKGQARIAWAKACKVADPNEIVLGALRFAEHTKKLGTEMQYIPYPATWLNGERWDDELWDEGSDWGDF